MKKWFKQQLRKRTRVYIFPTRMGGYLNGLIFLMVLLSIGYSNNLLLIFTLLLFSFNLIWVIQTHFQLNRLRLEQMTIADGHAGSRVKVSLKWKKKVERLKWDISLEGEKDNLILSIVDLSDEKLNGEVVLPYRGLFHWKYLKVSTDLPFGLYQVWIYFPLQEKSFAYPALLKNHLLPEALPSPFEGEQSSERKGHEDISSLSKYQGEESRRISWKHFAKSGDLWIKEGEALQSQLINIVPDLPLDPSSREKVLSEIATTMVVCHYTQIPFTFSGPKTLGPGFHQELLNQCLRELALC